MAKIIRKIYIIAFVLIFAVSLKVYANELILESPESIILENDTTLEFALKGNVTENINSIKIRYELPEGVELTSFTPAENWEIDQGGTSEDTGLILSHHSDEETDDVTDTTGDIEFGKFTFNVPSTYNKENIVFRIYAFDATNQARDIIDFEEEEYSKEVTITKTDENNNNENENLNGDDNNNTTSDDDDDNNQNNENNENNSSNNNNPSDGQENNNTNNSTTDPEQNNSNTDNNNETAEEQKEEQKNNNNQKNNAKQKDTTKQTNDQTVIKTPLGKFGKSNTILVVIAIISIIGTVCYIKSKKIKY